MGANEGDTVGTTVGFQEGEDVVGAKVVGEDVGVEVGV